MPSCYHTHQKLLLKACGLRHRAVCTIISVGHCI